MVSEQIPEDESAVCQGVGDNASLKFDAFTSSCHKQDELLRWLKKNPQNQPKPQPPPPPPKTQQNPKKQNKKKGGGGIAVHLGLHFRCTGTWIIQIFCNSPLHYEEKAPLFIPLIAN